jgi:hypothetical protein
MRAQFTVAVRPVCRCEQLTAAQCGAAQREGGNKSSADIINHLFGFEMRTQVCQPAIAIHRRGLVPKALAVQSRLSDGTQADPRGRLSAMPQRDPLCVCRKSASKTATSPQSALGSV